MTFKGREREGRIELDRVEGREKARELPQVWNCNKTALNKKMTKFFFSPSFQEVLYDIDMALIYYLHGYLINRICTWYFPSNFFFFTYKDPNLGECLANLAEAVGPLGVIGSFFPTASTLSPWWGQGATKCQVEWWSGLSRESRGLRPCWTLNWLPYPI